MYMCTLATLFIVTEPEALCPSVGPVNLVIVLDDTSEAHFVESRAIAQEILTNLGVNVDGIELQVTVVSSSQSVVMTGECEFSRKLDYMHQSPSVDASKS